MTSDDGSAAGIEVPDVRPQPPGVVLQHARDRAREALFGRAESDVAGGVPMDPTPDDRTIAESRRRIDRGATLGRYLVLGPLGRGGMGTVVKAYDESLDRAVAIKLLHAGTTERHAKRLRREAQALARLSHPHVVHVYEVGEDHGQWFIAMELVPGQTLREWQQPPPDWREAVRVYLQAGEGLRAAHAAGLIHRDFKPDNCILDEEGRVRVLDFGLVRETELASEERLATETSAEVESLTRTGAVLGTVAYMPIEQIDGRSVDARSDQFSFCVSLYEAVYGERPFAGRSMTTLGVAIRGGDVRPAPRGSTVPLALRKALLQGLAANADERWPSMEALLAELRRLVAPTRWRGTAVVVLGGLALLGVGVALGQYAEVMERCTGAQAQLEGVWDDARRQELEAAILATGAPFAADTWARVERRLTEYAEAWTDEHTEICRATRVTQEQSEEEMSLRMGCLRERKVALRAAVGVLSRADTKTVEKAVTLVAKLPRPTGCDDLAGLRAEVPPPEDPTVAAEVEMLNDRLVELDAEQDAGRYLYALEQVGPIVERAEALSYPPLAARAKLRRGLFRKADGRHDEAERDLLVAYELAMEYGDDDTALGAAQVLTHVVGEGLARPAEGRVWGRTAVAHAKRVGDQVELASSLNALGLVLKTEGRYEESREHLQRALELVEGSLGRDHPFAALCLNNLGLVASVLGDVELARSHHERALQIQQEALGPLHPDVGMSLGNLGALAWSQEQYESALRYHERSLEVFEQALSADHPRIASALMNVANVNYAQGDVEPAIRACERAQAIFEETLGPEHPAVAQTLSNLGTMLRQEGQRERALPLLKRALQIREASLGAEHIDVAVSLSNLALALRGQEQYAEAKHHYERALRIAEAVMGPEHPRVTHALIGLAEVAMAQGDFETARVHAERAVSVQQQDGGTPTRRAEADYTLARALWPLPEQRERARALMKRSRDARAARGEIKADEVAEIDQWLADHPIVATASSAAGPPK